MTDLHYDHPKLVSIYDLGNGWAADRDFYLSLAGDQPKRVLDLGCGTGLLCNAYAERGHLVTGVDPSASMLEVAKNKPFGERIEWVQSSAQSFECDKNSDLVVMVGHTFQVLLDDSDVASTYAGIRRHLDVDGLFAFETRNPCEVMIVYITRKSRNHLSDFGSGSHQINRTGLLQVPPACILHGTIHRIVN
jgi:predicted TPR repeat methyltransferase